MSHRAHPVVILVADDDADDRQLVAEAFLEAKVRNEIRFVEDGVELLEYLQRCGKYVEPAESPRPGLILLDLNMPRMDGREALGIIKGDRNLRAIRVIIMTTSKAEQDIVNSYDLSASSYIAKPVKFESLVDVVRTIGKYWLEIVELPPDDSDTSA